MTEKEKLTARFVSAIEQAERPIENLAAILDAIGNGPARFEFDKYDHRDPAWNYAEQLRGLARASRELADLLTGREAEHHEPGIIEGNADGFNPL